jgi:hypothetical protein
MEWDWGVLCRLCLWKIRWGYFFISLGFLCVGRYAKGGIGIELKQYKQELFQSLLVR